MKVRKLRIDFSRARAHWAPNREFAQNQNAASLMPVHVEPYLIRVMLEAKKRLGPEHAALQADVATFIHQETQHYKLHQQFNKALYAAGYDKLPFFERELADDYKRLLAERSLRFNCAYSEGFETLGHPRQDWPEPRGMREFMQRIERQYGVRPVPPKQDHATS